MKIQIPQNQDKVNNKLIEIMERLNFEVDKQTFTDSEIEHQSFNAANSYLNYLFSKGNIKGITTDVLNVRELPTTESDIIKTLAAGTEIEIESYSLETNFYKIADGYIYMDYVKIS